MCEICRCYPCKSACPNSDEKPLHFCDECGADIYEGYDFYQIKLEGYPTFNLCQQCIDHAKRIAEVDDE